jgi:hypothetical protein
MYLYKLSYFAVLWVVLLPILFFLVFRFSKRKYFLLFLYSIFSAFTPWISHFLAIRGQSSFLIVNLYTLSIAFILFFIFKRQNSNQIHTILFYLPLFVFMSLFFYEFNSRQLMQHSLIASSILYIFWSLVSIIQVIQNHSKKNENLRVMLLFNSAILIYFSGSLLLFFIFDQLNSTNYIIWTAHNFLEIIANLIISVAFWKLPSKSIS